MARRGEGTIADGLRLPPSGGLQAVTEGEACEDHLALVIDPDGGTTVALPDETRPTEALGWLDRTTLLVAAGGCGEPVDVYAVDGLGGRRPGRPRARGGAGCAADPGDQPPTHRAGAPGGGGTPDHGGRLIATSGRPVGRRDGPIGGPRI